MNFRLVDIKLRKFLDNCVSLDEKVCIQSPNPEYKLIHHGLLSNFNEDEYDDYFIGVITADIGVLRIVLR